MDLTQFKVRYPEFDAVDASLIQVSLEDSSLILSEKIWGKLYAQGLYALTAHRLAIKGVLNKSADGSTDYSKGSGYKSITSMTAGGLSLGYSSGTLPASASSDGDLGTTSYGLEYIRLKGLVSIPFMGVK